MIVTAGSAVLHMVRATVLSQRCQSRDHQRRAKNLHVKSTLERLFSAEALTEVQMAAKTPIDIAMATPIFSSRRISRLRRIHHGIMAKMRSQMPE